MTTFWPHDPPADAHVLVRATGVYLIQKVRDILDAHKIPYTMGGEPEVMEVTPDYN